MVKDSWLPDSKQGNRDAVDRRVGRTASEKEMIGIEQFKAKQCQNAFHAE